MNRARNNQTNTQNNNTRIQNNQNGMQSTPNTMPRQENNGMPVTGSLAEQIRSLCFVKNELELYLDTHPNCRTALDYYHRTIAELDRLTEEYQNTVGPLTARGNLSSEQWFWVDGPWPWQQAGDFMRGEER